MDHYTLHQGTAPLLISLPHDSSTIPQNIAERMLPAARKSVDTDWHVGRLYDPLANALGASVLKPLVSRYVVDLNRPADGHALYPGQHETGVVPLTAFDGTPLYSTDDTPQAVELAHRLELYWRPYHAALQRELARLLAEHGRVVLWEGHSIRSEVPLLFDGRLPDFNLGTSSGDSCGAGLQLKLQLALEAAAPYTHAVNGRFKGGYITRHYGDPARGVQAVQLELAQLNYMDEQSLAWREEPAIALRDRIMRLLQIALDGD